MATIASTFWHKFSVLFSKTPGAVQSFKSFGDKYSVVAIIKITKTDNSRPIVNLSKPIRINDTSLVFEEVNLVRPTDDHGNNENGAIFLEDGSNEVRLKNCDLSLQKFSFLYPTWGFAGICTLVLHGVSVTGDSTTRMIQTADGYHDLHLFNVISYETTYTGGIESRPDKGYDIPADRRGHILGVSI